MLDILLLRKDLASAVARLQTRKNPQPFLNVDAFQALEAERKGLIERDLAHVRPTERGFDFLSDLQALFLAD